jgi:hypothetical protein
MHGVRVRPLVDARRGAAPGSALEAVEDAPVSRGAIDVASLADAPVAHVVGAHGAVAAAAQAGVHVGDADERGLGSCTVVVHVDIM